jgi:hypothetical protein
VEGGTIWSLKAAKKDGERGTRRRGRGEAAAMVVFQGELLALLHMRPPDCIGS